MNQWKFIATDVDETSCKYAQQNVERNDMQNQITGKNQNLYPTIHQSSKFFRFISVSQKSSLVCKTSIPFDMRISALITDTHLSIRVPKAVLKGIWFEFTNVERRQCLKPLH